MKTRSQTGAAAGNSRIRPWLLNAFQKHTVFLYIPLIFLLSVAAIWEFTQTAHAKAEDIVSRKVQAALCAENWPALQSLLEKVGATEKSPPELRFIKGHACLAENQNNESYCFFKSLTSVNLTQCLEWANDFTERNTDSGIAAYLLGDALARQKRWPEAEKVLSENHSNATPFVRALTMNARGAVYLVCKKPNPALMDFIAATQLSEKLADAHANLGSYYVLLKEAPETAEQHFSEALAHSPEFLFALNGRASVRLVLGKAKEAQEDIRNALKVQSCGTETLDANLLQIRDKLASATQNDLSKLSPEEVGTILDKKFSDFTHNPTQGTANAFISALGGLDKNTQGKYITELTVFSDTNPEFRAKVAPLFQNGQMWNRDGGPASIFNSFVPQSVSFEQGATVGINLGVLGLSAGTKNGIGFGISTGENAKRVQQQNFNLFNQCSSALGVNFDQPGTPPPGGVLLEYSTAVFDDGQWPFVVQLGLLYPSE